MDCADSDWTEQKTNKNSTKDVSVAKYFLKNYRGASWKSGRLEIFYLIDFEGAKRLKQEAIIHNFY